MPSSKEYWQHAQQCLELAKEAEDFYVKSALIELAEKFKKQAEKIRGLRGIEWANFGV